MNNLIAMELNYFGRVPALRQRFWNPVIVDQGSFLFVYGERSNCNLRIVGYIKVAGGTTHQRVAAVPAAIVFLFCRLRFTTFAFCAGWLHRFGFGAGWSNGPGFRLRTGSGCCNGICKGQLTHQSTPYDRQYKSSGFHLLNKNSAYCPIIKAVEIINDYRKTSFLPLIKPEFYVLLL